MIQRFSPVTLQEATQNSPTLARLAELGRDSVARLKAIESLIPEQLRKTLTAGPIEGDEWCLIVSGNAAAAKLRQLQPALLAHLRTKGWAVQSIRLRVQTSRLNGR